VRVLALALYGVAATSAKLRDRDPALVQATFARARDLARAAGLEDMALSFARGQALDRRDLQAASALVEQALPPLLGAAEPLVVRALTRSASVAVSKGDVAQALTAIDRLMLLRS